MNQEEFIELHCLLSKLITLTQKVATTTKSFNKYNKSSITLLNTLPKHLVVLQQGLAIIDLPKSNNFTKKYNKRLMKTDQLEIAA